jgi:hypothetical protein
MRYICLYKYHCEMKLIGAIAVLVILATACQKEDIRPNPSNPAVNVRSDEPTSGDTVGGEGVIEDPNVITDPNDANRTNKNPKPKQ